MFGLTNNEDQDADLNEQPVGAAPTPVFTSNQSLDMPETPSDSPTMPGLNPQPPTPSAPPEISPSLPNLSTNVASAPAPSSSPANDSSTTLPQASSTTPASPSDFTDSQLIKMKQQALQSLAPLVDHLQQSPEEKFRTTMMLIQASDNAELVKEAFEAANQIKDDKARAQALLDVVNEINYFTHKAAQNQSGQKN